MTLRVRLLLTSLAVALPLAAVLFLIDQRLRRADMTARLNQFVTAELNSDVLARCQARGGLFGRGPRRSGDDRLGPGSGGRPGGEGAGGRDQGRRPPPPPRQAPADPPYEVFSYAPDGTPASVNVEPLSAGLLAGLNAGQMPTESYSTSDGTGLRLAVWLDRDAGVCSILLFQMRPRRGERRDQIAALLLVTLSAMAAAWFAAGPVISRMRRLAEDVHRSADTRYEERVPVSGRDEVAALAEAFNTAGARVREHLVELQRREDSLRQFVANTAHDVGLPLTVLQGHLDQVRGAGVRGAGVRGAEVRGAEVHDHLQAAIAEAHYIGSLIRNLHAATRLDATDRGAGPSDRGIEKHPVDLCALVERVASRHGVVARAMGVELNYAVPEETLTVGADVTLLEQAVSNLVDNAIRHNRAGGHVAIVLDQVGAGFRLTVTDDGPGVSEADLARLTERWFRSDDARTRRPDGQGLGLAIASEAVKRMNFSLSFSVPAGGGLTAEVGDRTN